MKKVLISLIFLSVNCILFAHPHMFISTTEEFVFEEGRIKGCWLEWTFDRYFSSEQDFYYDWDDNDFYDEKETRELYNNAFINLKNFNFFTFIRQGSKRTYPKEVHNFTARQEDGLLIYKFYIDLSYLTGNDFYISIYDYTFFCNIDYPEDSIKFKCNYDIIKPKYEICQNKDYPVYYDPYGAANDNSVYEKWRPGLETFYPYEIHIKY